jgi:GNAT superfamily N-acetyltransferase
MATQFRQLGPEDADLLVGFLLGWHGRDGLTVDPTAARREVERLLSDNQSWHSWLIEHGEQVIGYLMLNFKKGGLLEAHRAYVSALYVTPEARGLKIGRMAHCFIADLARWLQVRVFDFAIEREDRHAPVFARAARVPRGLDSFSQRVSA